MKRVLGRLIWSQSRDIRVLNYPHAMVYEIWTNQGLLKIGHCKESNSIYKVDECIGSSFVSQTQKYESYKDEEILIPTLK
jgi:hypothetical protein